MEKKTISCIINVKIKLMETFSKILIGIVAIEHLYIMYFEMFAWETIGKKNI